MPSRACLAVSYALLGLACAPADARQAAVPDKRIDAIFAEWDRADGPGCAATVLRDGKQVYRKGFGMASLEWGVPIGPDTVFYIASVSKQFTAAAIALLAEDGAIALEDDVRKYVPELPDYGKPITVKHLVHHTSGLRDYLFLSSLAGFDQADTYPLARALALIARQKGTHFPAGTQHRYSNTNYLLLSLIIERASGKSLREFADERIFKPLGMKNTRFYDDHTEIVEGRAMGHDGDAKNGWKLSRTSFALVGDGGLLTTVDDLVQWDRNFNDNKLGKQGQRLIERMTTPGKLDDGTPIGYGFGLGMDDYRGLPTVAHGGAFIGYRADMLRFPEQKLGVYVLCNNMSANPSKLTRAVADLVLEQRSNHP